MTSVRRRRLATQRWTPPAPPAPSASGPLVVVQRISSGGHGPEDVKLDADGRAVVGLADGTVVAIDLDTGERELVGSTGNGQVLGVFVCADGSVLACNHDRGVFRIRDGVAELLVGTVDGEPLTFASNVVEASDGTIYFTSSTARWTVDQYKGDLLEHSCTGRLVRRSPDGTVDVLVAGLAFANGVVLAADESHLVFAQTGAYSLSRYWLTGPNAGATELLVESLPGFPDNMSVGSDGLVWVAIASARNALLDALLPRPGLLRTLAWNLPEALQPKEADIAWVMAFTWEGEVVHDLRLEKGGYSFVTAVAEREGRLVLSSLHEDDLLVCTL